MKEKILYTKNSQILINKILLSNKTTLGEINMHTCTCKKDTNIVKMYGIEFDLSKPRDCREYAAEVLEGPWEEGSEGEATILTSPQETYFYIAQVIRGPWERGEEVIAQCPHHSLFYAEQVIKGPWERGEEAISNDPMRSLQYAESIIKGPWAKGEKAISKRVDYSIYYAVNVLGARFLIAEDRIRKEYVDTFKHINRWEEYKRKLSQIGVEVKD